MSHEITLGYAEVVDLGYIVTGKLFEQERQLEEIKKLWGNSDRKLWKDSIAKREAEVNKLKALRQVIVGGQSMTITHAANPITEKE